MKKILNIIIVIAILGSLLPLTYADDVMNSSNDVEIDAETQQQIEIMNNGFGAEIRLLQLENAIIKNINMGNEIISILNEYDMNVTNFELILAEFELVKQELQSADHNSSDAVNVFVDLKHDAVNLSKEFRQTLRALFNTSMLDQIQNQTRNMTNNQDGNLSQHIQYKIRHYNKNQFQKIYQLLGENWSLLIHRYQNGTMTQSQLKQNITESIKQAGKEKQFNFLALLKQEKIRYKIHAQYNGQNSGIGFQQRQENRLKGRLMRAENLSDNPLQTELMNRLRLKINATETPGNDDNQGGQGNGNQGSGDSKNDGSSNGHGGNNGHGGPQNPGGGGQ